MDRASLRMRYGELGRVLARNGFEWMWSKWRIGSVLGAPERPPNDSAAITRSQPQRLRVALEELGTTFIKIGQMLSTRPDLLPPEYLSELSKLQDDAPRVPYAEIVAAIEQEFGKGLDELFQTFDTEARAAGSIAQVHAATLPDGTPVVVKVRRPGIEKQVEQDLAIIGQLARFLAQHTDFARSLDLESLVEDFAFTLRNELDFTREGQNAERIAAEFQDDPRVHIPTVYWDFSGHTVLTMEDIRGIKIDDFEALDAARINRHELAETCANMALVQVLDYGFFHADPHPGNFFVLSDGSVALLDFGMVGRVNDRMRESLVRLALAVSRHDGERLFEELLSIGAAKGRVDRDAVLRDLDRLMEEYDGVSIGQISATKLFGEISATAQKHQLQLPSDLVLLARVVAMDEGMGAHLDPGFKFMEFSTPYFERFWRKSNSLPEISRRLKEGAIDLADFGKELPRRLQRLTSMAERGELTITSRLEVPDPMIKKLQHAANRIAISILMAGLIVGLSVLTQFYHPTGSDGFISFVLKALLAVAVVVGVWLLSAFWKSAR